MESTKKTWRCSACSRNAPASDFMRSQRDLGSKGSCTPCIMSRNLQKNTWRCSACGRDTPANGITKKQRRPSGRCIDCIKLGRDTKRVTKRARK